MLSRPLNKTSPQLELDAHKSFLEEVLRGCVKHTRPLQVALDHFYETTGRIHLRTDYTLYAVLFYLAIFRLSDLSGSFGFFSRCVKAFASKRPRRMLGMVQFLFSVDHLSALAEKWKTILDVTYVEEILVRPLLKFKNESNLLLVALSEVAEKGVVLSKTQRSPTVPEPFLLTIVPKSKTPPKEPEPSRVTKANPVPQHVLQGTNDREKLEKLKIENRERLERQLKEAEESQFEIVKRSQNTKKPIFRESPPSPKPMIRAQPILAPSTPPHIKPTATTILREDALVRRKRECDERRATTLEKSLRAEGEFNLELVEEQSKIEEQQRRRELELRHLEIQLTHEEAFAAKQALELQKKKEVEELKKEAEQLAQIIDEMKRERDENNKKVIADVQKVAEKVVQAKSKLLEENTKKGGDWSWKIPTMDVTQTSLQLKEQMEKEAEEERARRFDLIQQIRALERSLPPVRSIVKQVDLASTANLGILNEMSIAELQERLVMEKFRHYQNELSRRTQIICERKKREADLKSKLEEIGRDHVERRLVVSKKKSSCRRSEGSSPTGSLEDLDDRSTEVGSKRDRLEKLREQLEMKKAARKSATGLQREEYAKAARPPKPVVKPPPKTTSLPPFFASLLEDHEASVRGYENALEALRGTHMETNDLNDAEDHPKLVRLVTKEVDSKEGKKGRKKNHDKLTKAKIQYHGISTTTHNAMKDGEEGRPSEVVSFAKVVGIDSAGGDAITNEYI
ncbi:hypothetical protein BJ742DRAFT_766414 [Cladochytrium replicatum]|nr:hypothetical protein BJ742DRAFT_766414 [Cladochytrium replicatum]